MNFYLGVDIGAVSLKAALIGTESTTGLPVSAEAALRAVEAQPAPGNGHPRANVWVMPYRRTRGRPVEALRLMLEELFAVLPAERIAGLMLTGSGSDLIARQVGVPRCNEFQALARAVDLLSPAARTVFEIGGESSKFLRLEPGSAGERLGISDYGTNGDCAAGTGSFLDQQAGRLQYAVEEIGAIVAGADRAAQIAGRCSVFAKSDMIHAQQKGFSPPEVLRGLCKAVAVNYKSAVAKGRSPVAPVLLVGGVSANRAVLDELREAFELSEAQLRVPDAAESFAAIGAAILARDAESAVHGRIAQQLAQLTGRDGGQVYPFPTLPPLSLDKVRLLRDRVRPYDFTGRPTPIDAWLGIDIGSVGTKLALLDDAGEVIHFIFTRTEGRPIQVVSRIMKELRAEVGDRVRIRGVGTTGSGRELIGELIGADSITDEITCHKSGATFIGDQLLGRRPDTIFEIGGQDSKYISLEAESSTGGDTIVVDFTMNEACAAGTGSFLEERAEELSVSIKGEFAAEAFKSRTPIRLGERCTVFMERDVNTAMQRGARREDLIAGLAYSVVYNYINRVVRGRPIGQTVFFQGGTAYNDAVAAAFSQVTGKEVIVPPHNAVLGCIGAALMAREKITATQRPSRFRGYDLDAVDYALREFTCKGCGNLCSVQEFKVEQEKTFWGDKCSDRYRKAAKTDRKATIPDLIALRKELLMADDAGDPDDAETTIGIPLAMYTFDMLPLYRRFFRDCGFRVLTSDETSRRTVRFGYDSVVAEPCFPIIVAHGHVADLIERKVDYIWLPNVMSAETKFTDNESHVCPWGQTLPFVVRQAPPFRHWQGRILCPTLRFREGPQGVRETMIEQAVQLGVPRRRAERAFGVALEALLEFRRAYQQAGRDALQMLIHTGEKGIVLVGRPYNLHDPGVNLSTARKLREQYGVNLIPIDALPLADVDIRDINDNMFWEYGRRILAAGKLVGEHENLHVIYVTNFKCGPDSFVKGFLRPASGKPFLSLQFDGHSNDAGMMTRCEAYLDSKGILRWWRTCGNQAAVQTSAADDSTSLKWLTPGPGSWPPASERSGSTPGRHPTPTAERSS